VKRGKAEARTLAGLVGRRVEIEWRDDEADWPAFKVLAVDGPMILLRQAKADELPGGKRDPRPFWASLASIGTLSESRA